MRPTKEELKSLWLYVYARSSLLEAEQWLSSLARLAQNTPERRALIAASVIAYARPFTKSQVTLSERVVALKGVLPPSELTAAHKAALTLRDKMIGHKDATVAEGDMSPVNIMLINRDTTGFDLHSIIIGDMTDQLRSELLRLCSFFVTHCEEKCRPFLTAYGPEVMRKPLGVYELVVTEPPNEWIAKR